MDLITSTWGELVLGNYVQDAAGTLWRLDRIADTDQGRWYLFHDRHGNEKRVPPQPLEQPCTLLIPNLAEAEQLISETLGRGAWGRLEALAAQPARAARWRVAPFPARSVELARWHLHIMHEGYGTAADCKSIKQAREMHESLHTDPTHIMTRPHHHLEA